MTATSQHPRPCHACGYDLRGHDESGACPECGRPVRLSPRHAIASLGKATLVWLHWTLRLHTWGDLTGVASLLFLCCACIVRDGDVWWVAQLTGITLLFCAQATLAATTSRKLDRARIRRDTVRHASIGGMTAAATIVGSGAFFAYFGCSPHFGVWSPLPPAVRISFALLVPLVACRHLSFRAMARTLEASTRRPDAEWLRTWSHLRCWSEMGLLVCAIVLSEGLVDRVGSSSAALAAGLLAGLCGSVGLYIGSTLSTYWTASALMDEVGQGRDALA